MPVSFCVTAEAVVYEPIAANRETMRECLAALCFSNVVFADSLESLKALFFMRSPEILFCDRDRVDAPLHGLIQSLRLGGSTPNPFLVVVGMWWSHDDDVVTAARNTGADDLLERPFTAQSLGACLQSQINARKKFVVTSEYVGPDRRRDPSRSGAECFQVVNSLQLKSLQLENEDYTRCFQRELGASKAALNSERLRRIAFQLCVQWRLLERRRVGAPDFRDSLLRMRAISQEIAMRIVGEEPSRASDYCHELDDAIGAIEVTLVRSGDPAARTELRSAIADLGSAVMLLALLFAPDDLEPENLLALDQLVARLDVRRPELDDSREGPVLRHDAAYPELLACAV